MENIIINVLSDHETKQIPAKTGDSLLKALNNHGFNIPADCGGKGICGKCKIKLAEGSLAPSPQDQAFFTSEALDQGWRLACTAFPKQDITICLRLQEDQFEAITYYQPSPHKLDNFRQDEIAITLEKDNISITEKLKKVRKNLTLNSRMLAECSKIADEGAKQVYVVSSPSGIVGVRREPGEMYGIAVDIGTTTVGFGLIDLFTGAVKGQLSMINRQRKFGSDVISRTVNANNGALHDISATIRDQISEGAVALCRQSNINETNIGTMVITGNTTMLHLLLDLSLKTLAVYPFTPVTLDHITLDYGQLFTGSLHCPVEILPGISAYVGSDITAGILFTGLNQREKPALLLDIGTNGEMAVCAGDNIYCTSTAAGPAFEGGNIEWGMGSIPGAISSVVYTGNGFDIQTIGNKPPVGICGSGVIDAAYECLNHGLINKTGRFDQKITGNPYIVLGKTGENVEIKFTQKDIRQVQLGKSAVRSGIEILLNTAGLTYNDIEHLYIAGGFGYRINTESGTGIGLFPSELRERIVLVGNSSLGGAIKYMLNADCREHLADIISRSVEHSLSEDKSFNQIFVAHLNF